jgi:ABC-type multidrug transport system fused ATPase/permease subunit
MTPNEAPATTNPYRLSEAPAGQHSASIIGALKRLAPVMADQHASVVAAFVATIVASTVALVAPIIIGRTVDTYIRNRDFGGVMQSAAVLLLAYLTGLVATYVQTQQMGSVGRRVLFNLRNALFTKLQALPLDFFNQNKSGDLISRINNDTDKLNQFFSQALVQLAANLFLMAGAAIFILTLNIRLGLAALAPAAVALALTRATGAWVKRRNLASLQALGGLSGEIQESMSNFRVIVAFNRVDYFLQQFNVANERNYAASVQSGLANNIFIPLYGLAYNLAQLVVLAYSIYLISAGSMTVGLLIGFLLYVNSFYMPLRQLAAVWSSFQLAMASLDRISDMLALEPNMPQLPAPGGQSPAVLTFDHVEFSYVAGRPVLRDATFALDAGKTYALVGPTGGGKTTTASLMARLYDPTGGRVLLDGRDIRSYSPAERAERIGFILQEPFLFTGTVRDNIVYGNEALQRLSDDEIAARLTGKNLAGLLARFEQGLATAVTAGGDGVSLGQKQLIAFMRAVLREPQILILDEATANIDTVTEQLLEQILRELPASTTKVVIAHRLNTIDNADEIFFINAGEITPAGTMADALDLLMHGKRDS